MLLHAHRFANVLYEMVLFFPAFLLVFSFRGFFKAYVATKLGDPTPRQGRSVTLWPLAHINLYGVLGVLVCALACYAAFATKFSRAEFTVVFLALAIYWCVPVEYDERYFKRPVWGSILVILASACASLLVLVCATFVTKLLLWYGMNHLMRMRVPLLSLCQTLIDTASVSAILDLVPLPPFESGAIWFHILPQRATRMVQLLHDYSLAFIVVLFLLPGLGDRTLQFLVGLSNTLQHLAFTIFG